MVYKDVVINEVSSYYSPQSVVLGDVDPSNQGDGISKITMSVLMTLSTPMAPDSSSSSSTGE